MPAGIEEAPALTCESTELTTPDGSAVPAGRPDWRELAPALTCDNNELTSPGGRFERAGTPDGRAPRIDVGPALI
jgi:hypothetical protein